MTIHTMDHRTRKQLVQLACVAAWSDTTIQPEERTVILQLCIELALDERDMEEVRSWLDGAPPYFDPQDVPPEHRQDFLDALLAVVAADGRVSPDESETLMLIRELLDSPE